MSFLEIVTFVIAHEISFSQIVMNTTFSKMALLEIVSVVKSHEIGFSQILINTTFSKNALLKIVIVACANDGRIAEGIVFVAFFLPLEANILQILYFAAF